MKFLLYFAAVIAVASCFGKLKQKHNGLLAQAPRSVFQFNEMIVCATEESYFSSVLIYNGYGCYCGLGGDGVPVDPTDQCCEAHDACYKAANDNGCALLDKYLVDYHFVASRTVKDDPDSCSISCKAEDEYTFLDKINADCKAYMCECDRQGALCFGRERGSLDDKYVGWSQSNC
ncbi:phospholipase A2 AP-PLA2-I-like [Patiria miniata]|uniref:Phospholipase A2 n=1 Tax=Patiria miniata TaxID=46514 RepID=A0A914AR05_PATMI|nr:phospholipase A2 AP-PLA2-I-like [Patiria miniata]